MEMGTLKQVPIRIDFAGGWLDVPKLAIPGAFVVNCAFTPFVSADNWPYEKPGAGIGGSAAWRILNDADNAVAGEVDAGAGWQDPAIILETGLCVWRSGPTPVLEAKINPDFLAGRIGLLWTGQRQGTTPDLVANKRDYARIKDAADIASSAAKERSILGLSVAMSMSYTMQISEGMKELRVVRGAVRKYCGSGWGGYAAYLFSNARQRDASGMVRVEPYMR